MFKNILAYFIFFSLVICLSPANEVLYEKDGYKMADIVKYQGNYYVCGFGPFLLKYDTSQKKVLLPLLKNGSSKNKTYFSTAIIENNLVLANLDLINYSTKFEIYDHIQDKLTEVSFYEQNILRTIVSDYDNNKLYSFGINVNNNATELLEFDSSLNNPKVLKSFSLSLLDDCSKLHYLDGNLYYLNKKEKYLYSFNCDTKEETKIEINANNLQSMLASKSNFPLVIYKYNGEIRASKNEGKSWDIIKEGNDDFLNCIVKCFDSTLYAYSGTLSFSKIEMLVNESNEWQEIVSLNDEIITCFLIDGNKAFIGTYSGKILYNDNITSVQEWQVLEPNSLKVYPNPSSEYLTIDIKEEIKSFKIVDMQGNDVSGKVNLVGKTLDLTNLASGAYTLIIDGKTAQIAVSR